MGDAVHMMGIEANSGELVCMPFGVMSSVAAVRK